MRGKGKSMGRSQPQPGACSGRKTLRTCRSKKEADDVVLIDVDGDSFRNVILIDIPESLSKKIQGSDSRVPRKDKRCPLRTVIYIDDDESAEGDCNGTGVNGEGTFAGASPGMRCTTSYQNSADAAGDNCEFVQENISPVKLSKCKRTYSGKVSSGKRYGLTSDLDSDSSDSDNDDCDCEFMEGSFEQWETAKKANLKRKNDVRNGHQDIGGGNNTDKQAEASVSSTSSKADYEKEDSFEDLQERKGKSSLKRKNDVCKEDQASTSKFCDDDIHQDTERRSKASTSSLGKGYQFDNSEADVRAEDPCGNETFKHDDSSFRKEEQRSPQKSPLGPTDKQSTKHVDHVDISFQDKQESPHRGPVLSSSEPNEEVSDRNTQPSNEKVGETPKESLFSKFVRQLKRASSCLLEENEASAKSLVNGEDAADNLLHAQDGDDTDCIGNSLINEREKLKETDEYKRAVEEEWASRQRELHIQAEEAQHLRRMRKRRKAETMRLLDMEKRQKQRVEEIRETQKKDEENMNLKERVRAEVRKELQKLEVTCSDMASLLRGLGIVVNGGLHPPSQEVRVAYKKALLNFHPDRASQSDIRQQVEAEEKFKLISRMKDKFLPTS